MAKKRSLGIILSYIYTFLNMICGLVLSSFLLKQLGDTEYGLHQTVTAFATYLVMLEFGIGTVMSRNIALCRGRGEIDRIKNNASTLWYSSIVLSVVITAISIVFYFNIGNIYSNSMTIEQVAYAQKIFVVITGFLITSFLTNTLNGFLLGMEDYTYAQKLKIAKIISRTVLLLILITLKPKAIIIALVDLFISCCMLIAMFIQSKYKYQLRLKLSYFDKSVLKESLPLCLALLLQSVINQANSSIGKFIIGIQLTLESVALYSVAQYIYSIVSTVATIPISMYLPQVAKNMANGIKGKELTKTLVQPSRLVTIITGTILFGFVAVGRQFIEIFYGAEKLDAWMYALILIIPMFVNMTTGIIINVLDVANKRLTRSLSLLGTALLNIGITVALIPYCDVLGAALGTSISLILGNILVMNIYYKKVIKINVIWLYIQSYKGILPFQIISAIISFFVAKLISNIYISLIAGGVLYLAILAALVILFGLNESEKQTVNVVVKKVKNKLIKSGN